MSRVGDYAAKQRAEQRYDTSDLEAQIDESERRAMRLQKALLDETQMRARAERIRDDTFDELEEATIRLKEAEEKLNARKRRNKGTAKSGERAGDGGTVPDGAQRVDGSPSPKRTRNPKPVDERSDASPDRSDADRKSSRVRGNVK